MKNLRAASLFFLAAFFTVFMGFPLLHVLLKAFFVNGRPSFHFFWVMANTAFFQDVILNSLNIALAVTALCTVVAYPLALTLSRAKIPGAAYLHTLLLVPLVLPPFVGVLGFRQLFGRFGSVNILLMNLGIISSPIDWLGAGNVLGIILLQTIHLVPLLYLSVSASLKNAHIALEEAAIMSGASRLKTLVRVTLPLSYPGWFAGAVLVFISSFTDLGTPLVFEYRKVLSVQIFNMLTDLNENPVGYSFIVFVCLISMTLFLLSKASIMQGSFAGSPRAYGTLQQRRVSPLYAGLAIALIIAYIAFAAIPQLTVVLVALSNDWFMSVLPQRYTVDHFTEVIRHPLSLHGLITSVWLSAFASVLTVLIGFSSAYIVVRKPGRIGWLLELATILPLAIPGIVFAFGYIGAFAGTPLDHRINPFPLLIVAYVVRRMPAMVRSATAGLQEASASLEEAALMVGARPAAIACRIVLPLMRRHLAVGAILTFAYSMIEVSDGILLAMEERFYPISKAIYALMGRPDGIEVASALGSLVMFILIVAFYFAERLSTRQTSKRILQAVISITFLALTPVAHAEQRELVGVSSHWEGIRREFEREFSKHWQEKTGDTVTIRWLDIGGTSDIIKYLRTHFKSTPSGVGIDLIFGGGIDSLLELSRDGLLQSLAISPEVLGAIPSDLSGVPLYSANHEWFSSALNTFGIVVNRVAVERLALPIPTSWADLGKPEYRGLIGAGDPRKSGSMHAMYEIILQCYGWDEGWRIIQRIGGNVRNFTATAAQVGKEIATAEIVYGLAVDTYAGDVIRRVGADRISYVVPQDCTSVNGDGIAALKGAPNLDLAQSFVEFVLSERGQRLFYAKKGEPGGPRSYELGKLSLLPKLYGSVVTSSVVQGSPFAWSNVVRYDAQKAAARWNLVNDLFGVFILDLHEHLTALARRHHEQIAHRSPSDQNFTTSVLAQYPPFPISELDSQSLSANGTWGSDAALRSSTLQRWAQEGQSTFASEVGLGERLKVVPGVVFLGLLVWAVGRRVSKSVG